MIPIMRPAHFMILAALAASVFLFFNCGCGEVTLLAGDASASDAAADLHEEAGGPCSFYSSGADIRNPFSCAIETDSQTACVDALDCLCRAWQGSVDRSSIDLCIGRELIPRDAIGMADFCDDIPPARTTIQEALQFYLVENGVPEEAVVFSPECAAIPALSGLLPYDECALLDSLLCPCIPGFCDVNTVLDTRCLDLSIDEIWCVFNAGNDDPDRVCENLEIIDAILSLCTGG